MFKFASVSFILLSLLLSACGKSGDTPEFRSYELEVFHPSPYSTFVAVSPGARGQKLPTLKELETRDFNRYLRDLIGCTVAQDQEAYVVGNVRDPAGYMVPIKCVN